MVRWWAGEVVVGGRRTSILASRAKRFARITRKSACSVSTARRQVWKNSRATWPRHIFSTSLAAAAGVITTAAARREEAARMVWVGMEEFSDGNSLGFAAFFTARAERPIHASQPQV